MLLSVDLRINYSKGQRQGVIRAIHEYLYKFFLMLIQNRKRLPQILDIEWLPFPMNCFTRNASNVLSNGVKRQNKNRDKWEENGEMEDKTEPPEV